MVGAEAEAGPTVVIVDPSSSGQSLTGHCEEYGAHVVHLWQQSSAADHLRDTHPHRLLTHDVDSALAELKGAKPQAVWPGSEYGVAAAHELSMRLGLPHNHPDRADARRHKGAMVQALGAAGLDAPWSRALREDSDVVAALTEIRRYPVLLKPASSVGSDGCRICHTPQDVRSWHASLRSRANTMGTSNSTVLLQEFIDGPQYIVNTVSRDGVHILSDVWLYGIEEMDGKPMIRDSVLLTEFSEAENRAVEYTMACLDALGIRDGAAHSEVRITDRGPVLIETNSRLMGPLLPPDVYIGALGHSQASLLAESVLDPHAFVRRRRAPYRPSRSIGKSLLLIPDDGTIRAMPGLRHIRSLPGFHSLAKLPRLGTGVSAANPLAMGITGLAYFVHDDPAVLRSSLSRLHELEDGNMLFTLA